jgi:hypothetical protein
VSGCRGLAAAVISRGPSKPAKRTCSPAGRRCGSASSAPGSGTLDEAMEHGISHEWGAYPGNRAD